MKRKTHRSSSKFIFSKNNQKKLIASLVIILLAVFIGYKFILIQSNNYWNNLYKSYITPTPLAFYQQPKPRNTITNETPQIGWHLEKNTNGITKTVFIINPESGSIVQWNNLIFYSVSLKDENNENYNQIHEFNLDTEADRIVFDQNTQKNFPNSKGRPGLSQMKIINNTLYFWYSGYLANSGVFALPLPATGEAKLVATADGPDVVYFKNHYWIYASDGDGCGGWASYYLLNINTNEATHVLDSSEGCFEGEQYIGIDANDRMIVSYNTGGGDYTYIYAIPLGEPSIKQGIIAKQDMPQGITKVTYLSDTNQIFLSGKNSFFVDLSSNTMNQTNQIPATPSPQSTSFPYDISKLSDQINALTMPSEYKFILE
jgi:hypothetical protein